LAFAFAITAVLAHSQQILIYASIIFSYLIAGFSSLLRTGTFRLRSILFLIFIAVTSLFLFLILSDHISAKFEYYSSIAQNNTFFSLWKTLIFLMLTLHYSSSRIHVIWIFSTLLLAVVLVGPERINMLAYIFFMFYALKYKRGVNVGVALTSLYFGVKSIYFILDVLKTGQGFS
jgi:hypothetical protein